MYQVKEQGRNAVKFFNKNMADNARNVLVMEGDLHLALENKRFELYYQPRVDVASGRIVGAEALLRWSHPVRGPIPPMEFIPILETSGLVVDVGLWVLEVRPIQHVETAVGLHFRNDHVNGVAAYVDSGDTHMSISTQPHHTLLPLCSTMRGLRQEKEAISVPEVTPALLASVSSRYRIVHRAPTSTPTGSAPAGMS
jgi:hypothetical protein